MYYDKRSMGYTKMFSLYRDYIVIKPNVQNLCSDDNRISDTSSCYEELRKCWATKSSNDIPDDTMSRRIVSMLLSRAEVREEGSVLRRYIVMETSVSEQEALQKFGLGELKLREIDPILNKAIKTPEFNGFYEYVLMIYTFITRLSNLLIDHKEIVVSIIILISLCGTLYNLRWNFLMISFASIQVLLTISFSISWWKVLQKKQIIGTVFQDAQLPIQCQPDKMRWVDKAMAWLNYYDCDTNNEAPTKDSLSENTLEDEFINALGQVLVEMLVLSGKFLCWIPKVIALLPGISLLILGFLVCLLPLGIIILLTQLLYGLVKEPRKTYSTIENVCAVMNILEFLRNVRTRMSATTIATLGTFNNPSAKNNTKSENKDLLLDVNMYYKISCGTERSVILKIKAGMKNLGTSELEAKIRRILGNSIEVEKILGRIATREGERLTVAIKRKEDKEELIERWQQMMDNGIVVEEDIILLDEQARWNMFGLTDEKRVKEGNRKVSINGKVWIWDDETREWVQNKVLEEPENVKDSIKEAKS